jgi:hypothetical protein
VPDPRRPVPKGRLMIDVDEEELTVEEAVRIQHDVFPIG